MAQIASNLVIRVKAVPRVSLAGYLALESQNFGPKTLNFFKHNNDIVCQNDLVFFISVHLRMANDAIVRRLSFSLHKKMIFHFSSA